ncbi:MAG: substrate-binding domain-containing protein [Streptosporangiaceae bacterium]
MLTTLLATFATRVGTEADTAVVWGVFCLAASSLLALLFIPRVRGWTTWVWTHSLWPVGPYLLWFALGGMATSLLAGFVLDEAGRLSYEPCETRIDLRVLTAPESRAAFQHLGDQFADDQAAAAGCRPVRINVFAQSSVSALEDAFVHQVQWSGSTFAKGPAQVGSALLTPQPDVWIPPSSALVDDLLEQDQDDGLVSLGSIASSPLVLAVTQEQADRIGQRTGQTLQEILAKAVGPARPNPETSEMGLMVSYDLYRGHFSSSQRHREARQADEQRLAKTTMTGRGPADLLCAVRRSADASEVAPLVSEQVLFDYAAGSPLGSLCPASGQGTPLVAVYPSDTRALDFPFVRVSWTGQGGNARHQLIDRFHDWLTPGRLQTMGFRSPSGTAGDRLSRAGGFSHQGIPPGSAPSAAELRDTRAYLGQARRPLNTILALDISGSMSQKVASQVTKLDRARILARTTVRLLGSAGSADRVGIWSFPQWPGGGGLSIGRLLDPVDVRGPQADRLNPEINRLVTPNGGSSPLYKTLLEALNQVSADTSRTPSVVVLTDADDSVKIGPDGPSPNASQQWLEQVRNRINELHKDEIYPHIAVLAIGNRGWCTGKEARPLQRYLHCHDQDATDGDPESLLTEVIAELRRG